MSDAPKILGTDSLRNAYPKLNQAIDNANEALTTANSANSKSDDAVATANDANTKSDSTQTQLDAVVNRATDTDAMSRQAAVDASGVDKVNLKQRIDDDYNEVTSLLAQIAYNVKTFGAKGDGVTDDTQAIRDAIAACPKNGTVFFPASSSGYFCQAKAENYLFKIDKPIRIVGYGGSSSIVLAETIPNTVDVFLISPSSSSNTEGYGIEGIQIIGANGSTPARHAIHLDTTLEHQKIARSLFARNFIYPTGGWSIFLSNPTNSDGFFTSQIQKNLIYSGINLQRGGDSLIVTENTIAGYNGFDVSLVSGSNSLIFAYNNYTARGAIIFRNGHNIKILNNNIEVGYADSTYTNGALLDIDGTDNANSWGLLAIEVLGNNFTYRTTAPDGVTAIRINKARGTLIKGNFIANKNSTMIQLTSLAQETRLGYNLYSSEYPDGIIVDNGINTVREIVHKRDSVTGNREIYEIDSKVARWKAETMWDYLAQKNIEGVKTTTVPNYNLIWHVDNTFNSKGTFTTQQRNADGTLQTMKTVATMADGYLYFEKDALVLKDSSGFRWKINVGTDGVLTTTRMG